jgi:CRISPR-associated protein Cas1
MPDSNADDSPAIRPSIGPENTLYVDTCGAVVRREKNHFVVDAHREDGTERLLSVPCPEIDTLALVGSAHCTTAALHFCLQQEIQVVLLSYHGKVKGRLHGPHPANIDVRVAQYATQAEQERRVAFARMFVGAKIHNMRHRIRRTRQRRGEELLRDAARQLYVLPSHLSVADTTATILGIEGAATKAYFSAWPALITRSEPAFAFNGRTRRPPEDAVNALLSFTYSLLENDVHAGCVLAGLDPHLGLLHRPRAYAPTAVLDLMEAFRPVVADSVVLSLLNRKQIEADDFEARNGGMYLTKDGRTKVYRAYGRRRAEAVTPPGRDTALPYYRVFELQARRLSRALSGESAYQPFRLS